MGKEVQAILNLLSEGVIVEGDIQTPRDIRIDGTLVGTVHTDGRLVLGLLLVLREKSILRILTCSGTWRGI